MWSVGVGHFGLTTEAFWMLTPREYMKLARRFHEKYRMEMTGSAIVASLIFNTNRGKHDAALTAEDFLPNWKSPQKAVTPDAVINKIEAIHKALGGKPLKRKGGDADGSG